jgi:hypothetical protein
MKIRHGFVSNSSSSSFICFGVRFSADVSILGEDQIAEIVDDNRHLAYRDIEGDGYIYYGKSLIFDDTDPITNVLDGFPVHDMTQDRRAQIEKVARELFSIRDGDEIEFGFWVGSILT